MILQVGPYQAENTQKLFFVSFFCIRNDICRQQHPVENQHIGPDLEQNTTDTHTQKLTWLHKRHIENIGVLSNWNRFGYRFSLKQTQFEASLQHFKQL